MIATGVLWSAFMTIDHCNGVHERCAN